MAADARLGAERLQHHPERHTELSAGDGHAGLRVGGGGCEQGGASEPESR